MHPTSEIHRAQLEADADLLRARLAHTLESLDERRDEVTELPRQVARHPLFAALLGVGTTSVVAAGTALWVHRRARRRSRMRQRLRALARVWQHPEVIVNRASHLLLGEVARGVALGAATLALNELGRRAIVAVLQKLRPSAPPGTAVQ